MKKVWNLAGCELVSGVEILQVEEKPHPSKVQGK
jgi:hypothetical protein